MSEFNSLGNDFRGENFQNHEINEDSNNKGEPVNTSGNYQKDDEKNNPHNEIKGVSDDKPGERDKSGGKRNVPGDDRPGKPNNLDFNSRKKRRRPKLDPSKSKPEDLPIVNSSGKILTKNSFKDDEKPDKPPIVKSSENNANTDFFPNGLKPIGSFKESLAFARTQYLKGLEENNLKIFEIIQFKDDKLSRTQCQKKTKQYKGKLFNLKEIEKIDPGRKSIIRVKVDADTEFTNFIKRVLTMADYMPSVIELECKKLGYEHLCDYVKALKLKQDPGYTITCQFASPAEPDEKVIVCNPELLDFYGNKIPGWSYDFIPLELLEYSGYKISNEHSFDGIKNKSKRHTSRPIIFSIAAYFATADYLKITNKEGSVIKTLLHYTSLKKGERIEAEKHLRTIGSNEIEGAIPLNHMVTIDGLEYNIWVEYHDPGASHGTASLYDWGKASGLSMKDKDLISKEEKEDILRPFFSEQPRYEGYGLGDLVCWIGMEAYKEKMLEVYQLLGVGSYYREPCKTIGKTVSHLFEAHLANYLGIKVNPKKPTSWIKELQEKVIEPYISRANSKYLREEVRSTASRLSKVVGGRCRNNRPTDISIKAKGKKEKPVPLPAIDGNCTIEYISSIDSPGKIDYNSNPKFRIRYNSLIADIDISGCYGEGQRNMIYPLGKPITIDWRTEENNQYISLRNFLTTFKFDIDKYLKANDDKDYIACQKIVETSELVPTVWEVMGSGTLKYSQDLIPSWFESSHGLIKAKKSKASKAALALDKINPNSDFEFNPEWGETKIFNYEIKNGVIVHHLLEIILAMPKKNRNDFLDNFRVEAAIIYPRSSQIKGYKDGAEALAMLDKAYKQWNGVNTLNIEFKGNNPVMTKEFNQCHAWIGINMGELITDKLLIERKKAKILQGKKSPLDTLFKLIINTIYGVIVSPHFSIGNVVTGNNITGIARAFAYVMEKALNCFQTITDGGTFELNQVLANSRYPLLGDTHSYRPDSRLGKGNIKKYSLGGYQKIEGVICTWEDKGKTVNKIGLLCTRENGDIDDFIPTKEKPDVADEIVAILVLDHLREQFPTLSVLHNQTDSIEVNKKTLEISYKPRIGMFGLETKAIYNQGVFRATADYRLQVIDGSEILIDEDIRDTDKYFWEYLDEEIKIEVVKSRGNKKGVYESFILSSDGKNLEQTERYKESPGWQFLNEILTNPESIKPQHPYIQSSILKVKEYKNTPRKFDALGVEPGNNYKEAKIFHELSLSQFAFKSHEQYVNWLKFHQGLKDKKDKGKSLYGQGLEMFYLNKDGTLNYKKMIEEIEQHIYNGVMIPLEIYKDTLYENVPEEEKETEHHPLRHPHIDALTTLKQSLETKLQPKS